MIVLHYGKCDCCQIRLIPIAHFGYHTQPCRDYRLCEDCLQKALDIFKERCAGTTHQRT